MRRRNREVNIFNMSLLDILCGALGAFCFMMLSLFPDHAKVKDLQARLQAAERNNANADAGDPNAGARARQAEQRAQQAEQQAQQAQQQLEEARKQLQQARNDQSLVWFRVQWDGGQDIDLWVQGNSGKICSPKENFIPADKRGGCHITDRTKGPANEQYWFSNASGEGVWYRLFARLQNRNGVMTPAVVHGYMVARNSSGQQDVMSLDDLGAAQLTRDNELIELGWIQFSKTDFTVTRGPKKDGERIASVDPAPGGALALWRVDRWH
jgi:type II secretory pathway pseudopilin PulG